MFKTVVRRLWKVPKAQICGHFLEQKTQWSTTSIKTFTLFSVHMHQNVAARKQIKNSTHISEILTLSEIEYLCNEKKKTSTDSELTWKSEYNWFGEAQTNCLRQPLTRNDNLLASDLERAYSKLGSLRWLSELVERDNLPRISVSSRNSLIISFRK